MPFKKQFIIFFLSLFCFTGLKAQQQLTGSWEGDMGGDEFLQINVVQVGDKLCGYTWDHMWRNKRDYCKAYFNGFYDKVNRTWYLDGSSFMENSGSHVLMQIKCWITYENGDMVLKGYSVIKSMLSTLFGAGSPNLIKLSKISSKPAMMTETMVNCVKDLQPKKDTVVKTPPVVIVPKKKDTVIRVTAPPKRKDTVAVTTIPPKKIDSVAKLPPVIKIPPKADPIQQQLTMRKNKEMSRIVVTEKNLTLNVYDNATIDGDSVSIFYNGRMIMSHQRLSQEPIVINLVLDENVVIHTITMFAENLGSIPPNTALIIVTTPSGKRYELFSSATLEQNAVLVFEYKPGGN